MLSKVSWNQLVLADSNDSGFGWRLRIDGDQYIVTAPTKEVAILKASTPSSRVCNTLVLLKNGKVIVQPGSVIIESDELPPSYRPDGLYTMPIVYDAYCFEYFKRTNPEFVDKKKHTSEDFFPL